MKNFLHFSKNSSVLPDEAHTQLYKVLFDFLTERISVPGNTEQLIQLGYKSVGKGVEEVFHTYLLFATVLALECPVAE